MKIILAVLFIFIISSGCSSTYLMSGNPSHLAKVEQRKADKRFSTNQRKYKLYIKRTRIDTKMVQKYKSSKLVYKKRFYYRFNLNDTFINY